jgi:hypothetical protein
MTEMHFEMTKEYTNGFQKKQGHCPQGIYRDQR